MSDTPPVAPHRPSADDRAGNQRHRRPCLWFALIPVLLLTLLVERPLMSVLEPLNHGPLEHVLSNSVRWLGNGVVQVPILLLVVLAGAIWSRPLFRTAGWGLASFLLSGALVLPLKVLAARPRPWVGETPVDYWSDLIYMSDYMSFPSGDAATTFAVVVVFASSYPRARLPLFAAATVIAVARILCGSHFPSDVVVGAALGLGVGKLTVRLKEAQHERLEARQVGADIAGRNAGDWIGSRGGTWLLAAAAAGLLFWGLGGLPLFGRDEALYAEAAREMLAAGDWITPRVNGEPFFEKPPLYYWFAACAYRIFGVSTLAARLPAALSAVITLAVTVTVGARVWGRRAGLLAGVALVTCLQISLIGRMGIMDMPLTCLVTLGLVAYAGWRRNGTWAAATAFGAAIGLAVLLKGLAAALIPAIALAHALVRRRLQERMSAASVGLALLVSALIAAPWFAAMASRHGEAYASILFVREHLARVAQPMQGHGGPIYYYVVLIAISFFPWAVFLPRALRYKETGEEARGLWHSLLVVWVVVTLIPLSLIRTKLPGYVTPLFPAMALLVGVEMDRQLKRMTRGPWVALLIGGTLLGILVSLLPWAGWSVGERVGAAGEARRLVLPAALWLGACWVMGSGALAALSHRPRVGLGMVTLAQVGVALTVIFAVLPVLSPHLGGAEAQLARIAARELPDREVVLYDVRPEVVAFGLEQTVAVFGSDREDELVTRVTARPTALIAPAEDGRFWEHLPARRRWQCGNRVLLDIVPTD